MFVAQLYEVLMYQKDVFKRIRHIDVQGTLRSTWGPRHPYTGYTAQRPVRSTGGPCSEIERPVVILKSRTTIVFFTISVQLERYIITTYSNYVTVAYLYVKDDRFRGFFQATNVHSPT